MLDIASTIQGFKELSLDSPSVISNHFNAIPTSFLPIQPGKVLKGPSDSPKVTTHPAFPRIEGVYRV